MTDPVFYNPPEVPEHYIPGDVLQICMGFQDYNVTVLHNDLEKKILTYIYLPVFAIMEHEYSTVFIKLKGTFKKRSPFRRKLISLIPKKWKK